MPSDPRKLRLPRWLGTKARGELAESIFVVKAQSFGLEVSKPMGENHAFDFHVQSRRLGAFRVQVKSAWMHVPRGPYIVNLKHRWQNRRSGYDVVVIYLARRDLWYVIPASAINHQYLRLYPDNTNQRAKYEIYREGWRTLTGDIHDDTRRIGLNINAAADDGGTPTLERNRAEEPALRCEAGGPPFPSSTLSRSITTHEGAPSFATPAFGGAKGGQSPLGLLRVLCGLCGESS